MITHRQVQLIDITYYTHIFYIVVHYFKLTTLRKIYKIFRE